jgi:mRNA-degrading endonuclease RelE of RelBE toxin-antitoxin system
MAERITGYAFSSRFQKEYKALPKDIQEAFEKKLSLFLDNFHHPSLRVKRITGTIDRWEGSVTMNYRFTFQFEAGRVLFRRIGTHDILKKEN